MEKNWGDTPSANLRTNTLCVSASQDLVLTVSIKTNTIIENNFK